jgi:phosphate transport system permease protein
VFFIVPHIEPLHAWLNRYLGWIPLFERTAVGAKTIFTAGVVLAIMILPIIAAVSREVFLQVPHAHEEAAYALGATRWEMIRTAVLPFGRPGVISAAMLGVGRAMGETIAVALVIGGATAITPNVFAGGNTMAAIIVQQFGESTGTFTAALIGLGVVLFAMTVVVNLAARVVVNRAELRMRGAAS